MENWIVPCNIKFFDIIEFFKNNRQIAWKRSSSIREGDIVYLYIGSPFSQIKYKCKVLNENVSSELLNEFSYVQRGEGKKYMYIEMIAEYEDGTFPLNDLRKHGLGQVQKQARTDRKLQSYLDSITN